MAVTSVGVQRSQLMSEDLVQTTSKILDQSAHKGTHRESKSVRDEEWRRVSHRILHYISTLLIGKLGVVDPAWPRYQMSPEVDGAQIPESLRFG